MRANAAFAIAFNAQIMCRMSPGQLNYALSGDVLLWSVRP
jgi:hypothetical protein